MSAKRNDFDIHVGVERKRIQDGMQFIVAFHLEDTDIRETSYDAPEMLPLACTLKIGRALMLKPSEPLDRLAVNVRRNRDFDSYVKKHAISPLLIEPRHCAKPVLTPSRQ